MLLVEVGTVLGQFWDGFECTGDALHFHKLVSANLKGLCRRIHDKIEYNLLHFEPILMNLGWLET